MIKRCARYFLKKVFISSLVPWPFLLTTFYSAHAHSMFTKRFYRFNGTFGTIELVTLLRFSFLIVHVSLLYCSGTPPPPPPSPSLYHMINYDYNNNNYYIYYYNDYNYNNYTRIPTQVRRQPQGQRGICRASILPARGYAKLTQRGLGRSPSRFATFAPF